MNASTASCAHETERERLAHAPNKCWEGSADARQWVALRVRRGCPWATKLQLKEKESGLPSLHPGYSSNMIT